ncbi:MAG: hypothetical protein KGJ49_04960 [Alphaproteobacteria bacterium]|nr:hypothetical protein [Alphaproteobacteria bacterium]
MDHSSIFTRSLGIAAATALALFATASFAQNGSPGIAQVPAAIRATLDGKYPGWQLYDIDAMDPGERRYCNVKPEWSSVAAGDFDGDGNTDYALLIRHNQANYALAFLKRGGGYRLYNVFPAKPADRGGANFLAITARGQTLYDVERHRTIVAKTDGVTLIFCESSVTTHFFEKGKFRTVISQD